MHCGGRAAIALLCYLVQKAAVRKGMRAPRAVGGQLCRMNQYTECGHTAARHGAGVKRTRDRRGADISDARISQLQDCKAARRRGGGGCGNCGGCGCGCVSGRIRGCGSSRARAA